LLADERRFRITEILTWQRTVSAADLTTMLGVTAATIRRDLAALESKGLLVRSHGGAVSKSSTTSFNLPTRSRAAPILKKSAESPPRLSS